MYEYWGKPENNSPRPILYFYIMRHLKIFAANSGRSSVLHPSQSNLRNYANKIHTFASWLLKKKKLIKFRNLLIASSSQKSHVLQQPLVKNNETGLMIPFHSLEGPWVSHPWKDHLLLLTLMKKEMICNIVGFHFNHHKLKNRCLRSQKLSSII